MISIIGRGNVATHLYKAFKDKVDVIMVNPHSLEEIDYKSELILISVTDNAIKEVAGNLKPSNALIAHTSGSIPLKELEGVSDNIGVFYPLQTFTKGVDLDYSQIPVFIEASSQENIEKLRFYASLFSNSVAFADSGARKKLHLASVFACNFTNALAGIAQNILKDTGIEFKTMLPLLKQTINKLDSLSPKEAQTGPAARGDSKVIESHLEMLKDSPHLYQLYDILSKIISQSNS